MTVTGFLFLSFCLSAPLRLSFSVSFHFISQCLSEKHTLTHTHTYPLHLRQHRSKLLLQWCAFMPLCHQTDLQIRKKTCRPPPAVTNVLFRITNYKDPSVNIKDRWENETIWWPPWLTKAMETSGWNTCLLQTFMCPHSFQLCLSIFPFGFYFKGNSRQKETSGTIKGHIKTKNEACINWHRLSLV